MIKFSNVTFQYQPATAPVIQNFSGQINAGEFTLIVGKTGSGKSTLLNLINGTAPYLTGGTLFGTVDVFGRLTSNYQPRDFAELVGVVAQDPRNSFVTSSVEDELAYSMECLGINPSIMRQRIDEIVELMGISEILNSPIESLSAGQQQRVAISAVLVNYPKVLVLDEPTSALDPAAAEEVLAALQRLVHDLGVTVIAAEHKLERILQFADSIVYVPGFGNAIQIDSPATIMQISEIQPPIIKLGKELGWHPLPLSIRDAKKFTLPLMTSLDNHAQLTTSVKSPCIVKLSKVDISYADNCVFKNFNLEIEQGKTLAILGKNGAGKSTLLSSLAGLIKPDQGTLTVFDQDPSKLSQREFSRLIGFVPQEPADLFLQRSIAEECVLTDRNFNLSAGTTCSQVLNFIPEVDLASHSGDLSEGQRLLLALGLVMTNSPKMLLLDEPTRGLDYLAKERLLEVIREIKLNGTTVLIATHDVELVAEIADEVVLLSAGEIIASGTARDVLTNSLAFAPQVTRMFAPTNLITHKEVINALKLAG